MSENKNTVWIWDKEIYPKKELTLKCHSYVVEIANGGDLVVTTRKKRAVIIRKEMIDYVSFSDFRKSEIKKKLGSIEINMLAKYQDELADALLVEDMKCLFFGSEKGKEIDMFHTLASIMYSNGVRSSADVRRENALTSLKSRKQKILDEFTTRDIRCSHCNKKWQMIDVMMLSIIRCPWCGADLSGKDFANWFDDNSQFPEDCTIINGKLISRRYCSEEFYNIPDCVTEIGDGVFNRSPETMIHIGKNVKKIGSYAFANMPCLQAVEFEEGCEEIADNAFQNCPKLEYVNLPSTLKNVRFVEARAFYPGVVIGLFANCPSLKKIVLPDCLTEREYEREANLLPHDAKIYIRCSRSSFASSSVTYSEGAGFSENYNIYFGGTKIGTARGGFHGPSYTTKTTEYAMPENVIYNYSGTPDVIPFLWEANEPEFILKTIRDKKEECYSIDNGGLFCGVYDAASITGCSINKPRRFANGEIVVEISKVSPRTKLRRRHCACSHKMKFEYPAPEMQNVLKFADILRENGIFVEIND